ncbi:MAG: dipicolinate synthase subunit B [Eubacteriales bacterium]|nr:dipicolinate synthase subunit B [Clostridiales bacterium]MDD6932427.1 dipicolinate synthase subunit B [Eubacteriales bacterium]MDO4389590.1 dipicolinate synthase subunit B [Eubacteriales bacterium]MDY2601541.1 dipicolinate synthase subunit B [Eubacteriales bacterium]
MTEWKSVRIGCAMTGSFCTFRKVFQAWQALAETGAALTPIMSQAAYESDTRFYPAAEARRIFQEICGREIWHTIVETEPIGPKKLLDLLIIAPCTGNTLAKLAAGIADTPVTLAAKSHLRNGRPVLIAPSTNDGLGRNAENLGKLQAMRDFYFVPYGQDAPEGKPASLVSYFDRIPQAAQGALEGRQIQPLLI